MKKNNAPKKEITLQDLAEIMADGFDKSSEETDRKINDLALMVAKGFDEVNGKFDKINDRMDRMNGKMDKVEIELKDIKANLNKKVDKIDHNTLTYRVEKLEKNFA